MCAWAVNFGGRMPILLRMRDTATPAPTRTGMPPGPRWRRRARRAAWLGLAGYALLAGCSALDERQRQWIFQPSAASWGDTAQAAEGMQDVWIDFHSRVAEAPVRLHALWMPAARVDAPVLLYLHGARWGVVGSAPRIRRMQALGFHVLAIDYRGFGRSTGALPSEATAHEDARAAWHWIAARHPHAARYVFGHSLGGAIAVHLASEVDEVAGLMVEGTFSSVPQVFATMRWGWLPVGWLITQRFDSASRIGKVRAPVLVVHGQNDRLIAPTLGRRLYEHARGPKRWVLVPGGTHHDTHDRARADYEHAVYELFHLPRPRDETPEPQASGATAAAAMG